MDKKNISEARITTSFRFNGELLAKLKILAKRNNRSLNNYIETALFDMVSSKERSRSNNERPSSDSFDDSDIYCRKS